MSFELLNFAQNLYLRMKIDWTKIGIAFFFILLAAFTRLIPHPDNFTAIGALGIFSALSIHKRWLSAILPILAMWISDLVINNVLYSSYYTSFALFSEGAIWIYLGIFAHSWVVWLFDNKKVIVTASGASVAGAVIFFLLSNFGVWLSTTLYPPTLDGLVTCFAAGLPFLRNFLAGNLFFSLSLIGLYFLLEKRTKIFHLSA